MRNIFAILVLIILSGCSSRSDYLTEIDSLETRISSLEDAIQEIERTTSDNEYDDDYLVGIVQEIESSVEDINDELNSDISDLDYRLGNVESLSEYNETNISNIQYALQ